MGFTFKPEENRLRLEIEGKDYYVDPLSPTLIRGIAEFRELSFDFSDNFSAKMAEDVDVLKKSIVRVIESILGVKEFAEIRFGKELGLLDLVQFGVFIMQSYEAPRMANIEKFINGEKGAD